MTTPTSYSDTSLAEYMRSTLQATATTLGWTAIPGAGYTLTIHETVRAYGGIDAVASATDMQRLETLARREVWRQAMAETVNRMDAATGEERASLSQVFAHVRAMFVQAEADANLLPAVVAVLRRPSVALRNEVVW